MGFAIKPDIDIALGYPNFQKSLWMRIIGFLNYDYGYHYPAISILFRTLLMLMFDLRTGGMRASSSGTITGRVLTLASLGQITG